MLPHEYIFKQVEPLGLDPQHKVLILNNVKLKQSTEARASEIRNSVDISIKSDGKIGASSLKPGNLLMFSQNKFRASIISLIGTLGGLISGQLVATILGILGLIGTFMNKGEKEYSEQDAKVLLAIYRLGKICHVSTIRPQYKTSFGEELSEQQLENSLNLLAAYYTIQRKGEEVEIIESVNISRQ